MSNDKKDWLDICHINDLVPNAGRCALVNGEQVAIFRLNSSSNDEFYAIHNHDPFSNANVLSRGITGSLADRVVVASPIYKQHFCLKTGQCIEDEDVQLKTYKIRVDKDVIQLSA